MIYRRCEDCAFFAGECTGTENPCDGWVPNGEAIRQDFIDRAAIAIVGGVQGSDNYAPADAVISAAVALWDAREKERKGEK